MRPNSSRPTEETTTSIDAPSLAARTVSTSLRPAAVHPVRASRSTGTTLKAPATAGSLRLTNAAPPRLSTSRPLSSVETSPVTRAPRSTAQATA